jgi:hypothetical protein
MDAGAALAETFSKPVNTGASFTRYGTVVKNNGTTLDVELCGATLAAVPMLTTCAGAKAGDRCLLTVDGPLATVTGILANADNAHYVNRLMEYVPWTVLYGSIDEDCVRYMVSGGMVTLSVRLRVTTSGMTVPSMPARYRPSMSMYLSSYFYGSNNVMGAWVPSRSNDSMPIYLYDLASGAGNLLSSSWSWPLEP